MHRIRLASALRVAAIGALLISISAHQAAGATTNSSDDVETTTTTTCSSSDDLMPSNLFSDEAMREGGILVNFLIAFYGFYCIAMVCDNYFLPCVQVICEVLGLPQDVAAATFMSVATSTPELFVNIISTFLANSDMGVGTTVGSATFNILGISSCIGLACLGPIHVRWQPVLRDSVAYCLAVGVTMSVVWDGVVEWYEALTMILCSLLYLAFMFTHRRLALWFKHLWRSDSSVTLTSCTTIVTTAPEKPIPDPLEAIKRQQEIISVSEKSAVGTDERGCCLRFLLTIWWLMTKPVKVALWLTIPDCRKPRVRPFFFATFLMCIVWIAIAAYIVSWMITGIGDAFSIPDAVMGITLTAVGGSLPEGTSAIIMSRKGVGSMGLANGLGANTLNMLMNLGMTWLVRSALGQNTTDILSEGLALDLMLLIAAVVMLNLILLCSRYYLSRKQGVVTVIVYITFIVLLVLNELNVFKLYSDSTCSS